MPPTMRADDIPVGWIGCVPHMRPPPPGGGCGAGRTGKQRKQQQLLLLLLLVVVNNHSSNSYTLPTSYIEMFINVRIPDVKTKPTCTPAAAAAAKRPVKRKATSVDRVVRLRNDQHG